MFEDFINALNNFRTNKMRTTLSLLGIIIGVTSVVIITTLGNSLQKSMEQEFSKYSLKVLIMSADWNPKTNEQAIKFDNEFRKKAMKEIPEIKSIFYLPHAAANISRKNINLNGRSVQVTEPHRLEDLEITMDYGNFFEMADYIIGENKAILGHKLALELFPEGNAIGKKITLKVNSGQLIHPYSFTVCGVLNDTMTWFMNANSSVFIPKASYDKIYDARKQEISNAEVVAFNENDAPLIKNKLEKLAKESCPDVYRPIWVSSAKSQLDQANNVLGMVRMVILAIGGISLLVGGIGIMNIMLVTVTERKKEIGIRKALGATNRAIKLQFLVESATLTLTGGFAGVAFGMLLGKLIIENLMPDKARLTFFFDPKGTLIAFGVSVFIGIFFGLHPAAKAAKLDPVVALGD